MHRSFHSAAGLWLTWPAFGRSFRLHDALQAITQSFFPHFRVVHTSKHHSGQIYVPVVNNMCGNTSSCSLVDAAEHFTSSKPNAMPLLTALRPW